MIMITDEETSLTEELLIAYIASDRQEPVDDQKRRAAGVIEYQWARILCTPLLSHP